MSILLLLGSALAGVLVVDAKIPARVAVDGNLVADVYQEGELRVSLKDGPHAVVVTTDGTPRAYDVVVGEEPVVILVGRTGTTVSAATAPSVPAIAGEVDVRFRAVDADRLLVQVGKHRVVVSGGRGAVLPLPLGQHAMSVRSVDGTRIYARGVLEVTGSGDLLVQVGEGRMPETSGDGVAFRAESR